MDKPLWAHLYEWIESGFMTRELQHKHFSDYFRYCFVVFLKTTNQFNGTIQANVVTVCVGGGGREAGRPLRGPVWFGHVTIVHGVCCVLFWKPNIGPNRFTAKSVLFPPMLVTARLFPNLF